jgi:hypothetical protein
LPSPSSLRVQVPLPVVEKAKACRSLPPFQIDASSGKLGVLAPGL